MKTLRLLSISVLFCLALGTLVRAHAADHKPAAPVGPSTNTLALLDAPIPQAVFNAGGGKVKDPFFPRSTRLQTVAPTTNSAPPPISASSFTLSGISISPGTSDSLAIINGHALAVGETANVTISATGQKVVIKLVAIKETSVQIQAEGRSDPFEISLPIPKISRKDN
jgi:hypothetical protein